MYKMKFSDGKKTEIEYLDALESEEYFNGASRRTLTFQMARDAANLETLDALCGNENNVAKIELINTDDGVTNIYDGYVLKLKVGVEKQQISPESPESAAVYEDRVVLKLGKRTYIEEQLHKLGL